MSFPLREPRSASFEASSTSLSQYALEDGTVGAQVRSPEGVATGWAVGIAGADDTTGMVPAIPLQAPHSRVRTAATNLPPQHPMTWSLQ